MNILTFDIEDWWVYDHYALGNASDYLPRLDSYLSEILDLLDTRNFKATFFCLGLVALHYPEVIKKIASRGHHIGCHSYSHRFLGDLNPKEFAADTKLAIDCLEDIIGTKVNSYRAPAFSITEDKKWAFEILAENGIEYDCSIYPSTRSFGGFPNFNQKVPSIINYQGIQIKEFPISTISILGKEIAYSGGGYFRLFPYHKIHSIINNSDYVMTYFHIKDFDRLQKRKLNSFQGESAVIRYLKDYYGLKNNFLKFSKLLSEFEFVSVKQAEENINWKIAPVVNI